MIMMFLQFIAFKRHGLERQVRVNIEQGHAILAGHSFEHEIALANSLGFFGSIDMNRNDYQSGWDTDQFENNPAEVALAYYHILKNGGFKTGGTNFDAKLRRQSLEPDDLPNTLGQLMYVREDCVRQHQCRKW